MGPPSVQPGIADGDWNGVVCVIVFVTVGGAGCRSFLSCALRTIRIAITMASAPSTPAAHSSARWPDENVRRGGGGRCPPVTGRALVAGAGPRAVMAALGGADPTAVGAARPRAGAALGRGGRRPDRTAATASANGPPERYRMPGFFTSVISISSRTLGGRSLGRGAGVSLMCFIATVRAPSPVNGRLPETDS